MNSSAALVEKLAKSPWWDGVLKIIESDHDMNVQIRGNYLNIYYKMNNALKIVLKNRDAVACQTHYKFNPFAGRRRGLKNNYITLIVQDGYLVGPRSNNRYQYTIDIFSKNNLRLLKRKIRPFVGNEKSYQSQLVYDNRKTILDAEIAFNEKGEKDFPGEKKKQRTRIDLLNYDKRNKKIVAVELKMVENKELYNGSIQKQLEKYTLFLTNHEEKIKTAYEDSTKTKMALGLLPKDSVLWNADFKNVEIVKKPLLVVVCHSQKGINEVKEKIIKAVEDHALGVFFFGKTGDLNIPSKKCRNKTIFNQCNS